MSHHWPTRVVCLTEESVEFLYALGLGEFVVGVSQYVRRPHEATSKPKISSFIKADIDRILALKPDLVISFSDIQAQITHDLMKVGIPVFGTNQRSIDEILRTLRQIGALLGHGDEANAKCCEYEKGLEKMADKASLLPSRPRVYFEEWNDPMITGIKWVSEVIEICGGENVFANLADMSLATDRIVSLEQIIEADPEIVLASWCGKPFNKESFVVRQGFSAISAVKNDEIHALAPEIILQPGPAVLTDGLEMVYHLIEQMSQRSQL